MLTVIDQLCLFILAPPSPSPFPNHQVTQGEHAAAMTSHQIFLSALGVGQNIFCALTKIEILKLKQQCKINNNMKKV